MNVLLIAYYYDQPGSGGVERPRSLVRHFTAAGHRVAVLTSDWAADRREGSLFAVWDPSSNGRRQGAGFVHWLARRLTVEAGLRLGRPASILSGWRRRVERLAGPFLAEAAPQIVLATYPPAENLMLGLRISRQSGLPLVADFRDGLLFEPVERRALRHPAVRRGYAALESRVAREAAAIVTVSPPISEYFLKHYGCFRIVTIPNGYEVAPPTSPPELPPFAADRFHLVHTGSISVSDRGCDLAPLVSAVHRTIAEAPELRGRLMLHFAGRLSAGERRLLRPLADSGLASVYGPLPREVALGMQRKADLLLLLTSPDRTSVATGKLFEYMAARRPVLGLTAGTFAASLIAETGIGWTVSPQDPPAISAMLTAIARGTLPPPVFDELAIARYDRRRQAETFLEELQRVMSHAATGPAPAAAPTRS